MDEVDLQLLPMILGEPQPPALFEGYNPGLAKSPLPLRLIEQQARPDGSLLLRSTPERRR